MHDKIIFMQINGVGERSSVLAEVVEANCVELFFGYLSFLGRTLRTRVRKGHTCYVFGVGREFVQPGWLAGWGSVCVWCGPPRNGGPNLSKPSHLPPSSKRRRQYFPRQRVSVSDVEATLVVGALMRVGASTRKM